MIVRFPSPLSVRSSLLKITPFILSSAFVLNVPPLVRLFKLPSSKVTKTLSAPATYIAAESELVMSHPARIICISSSLPASTTICPSESVPDMTYVPAEPMVTVLPAILTDEELQDAESPVSSICTASLVSYEGSVSFSDPMIMFSDDVSLFTSVLVVGSVMLSPVASITDVHA